MLAFLESIGAHPHAALLVVALVALAESLAIVGTVVPAAIVMFGAGALVGNGSLDLWETLVAATLGAVLGDGLSYELGRNYEASTRSWPMFRRLGKGIGRGEAFIQRHGGMSVVLARFAGAVRAFVPLLAGFAHMPRVRFYAVNLSSALLWAPAHILPGVLFGTSLALAEAVSGRLAVVILLLVFLVWSVAWLMSTALRFGVPRVQRLRDAVVRHAHGRTSLVARASLALLDPQRPGSHALLWGTGVVLGAGWLFLGVLEDVLAHDPMVQADAAVFRFLQGLRSEPVDRLMVAITELGSVGVMLPLIAVVLTWLLWRRCWRTAAYWVGAAAFSELLVQLLKVTLGRHRPVDNLYAGVEQYSFPSGHATLSTVVLAFLAFLLSRGQRRTLRFGVAVTVGVYVALVAFSRLYLGAHWLSDVLGGMSLGIGWVAFVAMVHTQRQIQEDIAPRALLLTVIATLLVLSGAWIHWRAADDLARFTVPVQRRLMTEEAWLNSGWQQLPAQRLEMAGDTEEPLQLQWACSEEGMAGALKAAGWQDPPAWSLKTVLGSLAPHTAIWDLPILPRFNRGDRSQLIFARWSAQQPDQREVLRLWRSDSDLESSGAMHQPLWYGAVYREVRRGSGHLAQGLLRQSILPPDAFAALLPAIGLKEIRTRDSGQTQTALMRCGASSSGRAASQGR